MKTPDEIAQKIMDQTSGFAAIQIKALIEEVAEECAKIADELHPLSCGDLDTCDHSDACWDHAANIAKKIRETIKGAMDEH